MANAKIELVKILKSKPIIKCAKVTTGDGWDEINEVHYLLKVGYSETDFLKFIKSLDFLYDSGYGGQELFGTIWFEGGDWLSRGEYDGSEWWKYNTTPKIPKEII